MTEDYAARKLDGRCTQQGCKRVAGDGAQLCPKHLNRKRAARARSAQKARAAKRAKKLCAVCGRKSPRRFRCAGCKVKRNAIRATRRPLKIDGVGNGVGKRLAIERRTAVDQSGRTRYHGQERRGQQPRSQLDDKDIDDAIAALRRVKHGLAMVRDPVNAHAPRMQLKEATEAVLAVGALGCRLYGNVLIRNGCDPEMLVTARDDEG